MSEGTICGAKKVVHFKYPGMGTDGMRRMNWASEKWIVIGCNQYEGHEGDHGCELVNDDGRVVANVRWREPKIPPDMPLDSSKTK